MEVKLVLSILLGVTVFYAGILTLADDTEAGIAMMAAGTLVTAMPLWKAFRRFKKPPGTGTDSLQSGKRKRAVHLRVVRPEEEDERPTYH
jgi:membrane protein implicated in regulation of membrane protease activity